MQAICARILVKSSSRGEWRLIFQWLMWIRDSTLLFENGRSPRERPDIQTALRYLPMIGAVAREGRQRVENLRRQRELRPQRQLYQICANRQLFQRTSPVDRPLKAANHQGTV